MRLRFAAVAAASLCLGAAAVAAPVAQYKAVDLMALGTGTQSFGYGIANGGAVTGSSYFNQVAGDPSHALRSTAGGLQDLGSLTPGGFSEGRAINAAGVVVGSAQDPQNPNGYHAAMWTAGGITDLNPTGANYSRATGINTSGQVTGYYDHYFDGFGGHIVSGFVSGGGSFRELAPLAGNFASANAINDAGQVAGNSTIQNGGSLQHGFYFDGTTMHDIGALNSSFNSRANAINDSGQVVGGADVAPANSHVILYQNGVLADLGLLAGSYSSEATDINNAGVIVGNAFSAGNRHGVVAFNQVLYDLADLITEGFDGWHITDIQGINDEGQIVGTAQSDDGRFIHAFRFDPTVAVNAVPEPGGLALVLAAAGAALLATARRGRSRVATAAPLGNNASEVSA